MLLTALPLFQRLWPPVAWNQSYCSVPRSYPGLPLPQQMIFRTKPWDQITQNGPPWFPATHMPISPSPFLSSSPKGKHFWYPYLCSEFIQALALFCWTLTSFSTILLLIPLPWFYQHAEIPSTVENPAVFSLSCLKSIFWSFWLCINTDVTTQLCGPSLSVSQFSHLWNAGTHLRVSRVHLDGLPFSPSLSLTTQLLKRSADTGCLHVPITSLL